MLNTTLRMVPAAGGGGRETGYEEARSWGIGKDSMQSMGVSAGRLILLLLLLLLIFCRYKV